MLDEYPNSKHWRHNSTLKGDRSNEARERTAKTGAENTGRRRRTEITEQRVNGKRPWTTLGRANDGYFEFVSIRKSANAHPTTRLPLEFAMAPRPSGWPKRSFCCYIEPGGAIRGRSRASYA
jgi:hypothetical protein